MTNRLPHICVPVGPEMKDALLRGGLDSMAGVSMGDAQCHRALAETHPHIVANIIDFAKEGLEDILIGGINSDNEKGCKITGVINCKTPYSINGQKPTIAIAMCQNLSTRTIFGIPFIKKAQMNCNFQKDFACSNYFRAVFEIQHVAPNKNNRLDLQDDGHVKVLQATCDCLEKGGSTKNAVTMLNKAPAVLTQTSAPDSDSSPETCYGSDADKASVGLPSASSASSVEPPTRKRRAIVTHPAGPVDKPE